MPIQDRTHEFRACVDSIRNRSAGRGVSANAHAHAGKQMLLQNGRRGNGNVSQKSEFSRMAAGIGKDIGKTTANLGKLAQCECCCYCMRGGVDGADGGFFDSGEAQDVV